MVWNLIKIFFVLSIFVLGMSNVGYATDNQQTNKTIGNNETIYNISMKEGEIINMDLKLSIWDQLLFFTGIYCMIMIIYLIHRKKVKHMQPSPSVDFSVKIVNK